MSLTTSLKMIPPSSLSIFLPSFIFLYRLIISDVLYISHFYLTYFLTR